MSETARCDAEFLYPGDTFTANCSRTYGHRGWHLARDSQPAMDPPVDFVIEWENLGDLT